MKLVIQNEAGIAYTPISTVEEGLDQVQELIQRPTPWMVLDDACRVVFTGLDVTAPLHPDHLAFLNGPIP